MVDTLLLVCDFVMDFEFAAVNRRNVAKRVAAKLIGSQSSCCYS
jgi:hypothetical protein